MTDEAAPDSRDTAIENWSTVAAVGLSVANMLSVLALAYRIPAPSSCVDVAIWALWLFSSFVLLFFRKEGVLVFLLGSLVLFIFLGRAYSAYLLLFLKIDSIGVKGDWALFFAGFTGFISIAILAY